MILQPKLLRAIFVHPPHIVPETERQNLHKAITASFMEMDEKARRIIELYYDDGMNQSDIAQKEQITASQVSKILSRSLQQLRMAGNPAYAATVKKSFLSNKIN